MLELLNLLCYTISNERNECISLYSLYERSLILGGTICTQKKVIQ